MIEDEDYDEEDENDDMWSGDQYGLYAFIYHLPFSFNEDGTLIVSL